MQLYVSRQVMFTNLAAPLQLSATQLAIHSFLEAALQMSPASWFTLPVSCHAVFFNKIVHLTLNLPFCYLQTARSPLLEASIQLYSASWSPYFNLLCSCLQAAYSPYLEAAMQLSSTSLFTFCSRPLILSSGVSSCFNIKS